MIVEFLGLPGAGKSTLSQLAAEALAERGIAVECANRMLGSGVGPTRRWLRKSGCVIDGLVCAPHDLGNAIRSVNRTRQRSLSEFLHTTFNWLLVTALVRRAARSPKVVLLDQGVAQALWSIGLSAQGEAWQDIMRRAASLAPAPDMIVLVNADPSNIASRLAARPRNRSRTHGYASSRPRTAGSSLGSPQRGDRHHAMPAGADHHREQRAPPTARRQCGYDRAGDHHDP